MLHKYACLYVAQYAEYELSIPSYEDVMATLRAAQRNTIFKITYYTGD